LAYSSEHDEIPNPLRAGLRGDAVPEPCAVVVFGGSGDLAHRKILPALYNLALNAHLPAAFGVVGVSRSEYTDEQYRAEMREAVGRFSRTQPVQEDVWKDFAAGLRYCAGSFDDPSTYRRLGEVLQELDRTRATRGNRLFYLATPPSTFPVILRNLKDAGLINKDGEGPFTRVVVEKPFGHDLASARELNRLLLQVCDEKQIFRIDHYLGKETVQNMLALRFANGIFEPIWNRQFIDHVQITVAESIGIEGRAGYYERAGAIRDIFQNHLLQLVALTAMIAAAGSIFTSAVNVKYRDIRHALPFAIQTLMFLTPVIYPVSFLPQQWRWVLMLNPLSGIIEGFRAAIFGNPFDWQGLAISTAIVAGLLTTAAYSFRRMERQFADVI